MKLAIADVREGERGPAIGAFLVLFGIMAAHALLETSRDALFLARIDARRLPLVYLGIALIAIPFSTLRLGVTRSWERRSVLAMWLVVSAILTLVFWLLVGSSGTWTLYGFYVWSGLFSTLSVVQFWVLMGDAFTVTQAKRLFAVIGTGSILGAIAGSMARSARDRPPGNARASASRFGDPGRHRGELAAPSKARGPGGSGHGVGQRPHDAPITAAAARRFLGHPYVKRLAALVLLSTITLTLADFIFKSTIQNVVMHPANAAGAPASAELASNQLGWIFATAYLVFNCLSLIAQLTIVAWMTRHWGADRVLAFLPALLLGSSLWLAIGGGVLAAILLKGFDGTLRHSLHRTAIEVLYVPLPGEWRASIKSLVDVLGQRGGQALASVGILGGMSAHSAFARWPGSLEVHLAILVGLLCIAWIVVAKGLHRHYFDLFREALQSHGARARLDFPDLDLASLETLIAALGKPDEREVIAALDLLAAKDRTRLVPALILYHPSPAVVRRALDMFDAAGRTDHLGLLGHLLEHEDAAVREAALLRTPAGTERRALLDRFVADASPEVRATAIVGLLSEGGPLHPRVESILDTLIRAGSAEAKQSLARAIGRAPAARFDGILVLLANSGDPRVSREVAVAMRAAPNPAHLESLVAMLPSRVSRDDARSALLAIGPPAFDFLVQALGERTLPLRTRRQLPRTIARFDPQEAATALLAHLLIEDDGVTRYKTVRTLGRLRTDHPSIRLDEASLDRAVETNLRDASLTLEWGARLGRVSPPEPRELGPGDGDSPTAKAIAFLKELLEEKHANALERIFRLLQLKHPREDFRRMYRGLA